MSGVFSLYTLAISFTALSFCLPWLEFRKMAEVSALCEPMAKIARFASSSAEKQEEIVARAVPQKTREANEFWACVFDDYCKEKEELASIVKGQKDKRRPRV